MFEQIRRASEIVFYIMGCSFFLLYMMYHNGIGAEWARWLMELFDQSFILVALLYGGTSFLRTLTDYATKKNKLELLEAQNVVESNSIFHLISNAVKEEIGELDNKIIYEKWLEWLKNK